MGHMPPKPSELKGITQPPYSDYCLLPRCSPRATEFPRSGQLFVRLTSIWVCKLQQNFLAFGGPLDKIQSW